MRYIRYYEDNQWKYCSVKDVGDMSILKTNNKISLVEAINELIDNGILEIVNGTITGLEDRIDGAETNISDQSITIGEQATFIQNQQDLIESLEQAQFEFSQKASLMEQDVNIIKTEQQDLATELGKKLDFTQYQEQYSTLVEELQSKASNIDIQSVVDNIDNDLVQQQIEIDESRNNILDLDTKVEIAKENISNNIDKIQGDIATLDGEIDSAKTLLEQKINTDIGNVNETISGVQTNLSTARQDIDDTIANLGNTKDELDSVKNNVVYKIEIISSDGNVFKNGQFNTTLEAKVYRGKNDVTDQFNAVKFKWTRKSDDIEDDSIWNSINAGGRKSIIITPADVKYRATFNCELLE